MNPLRSFHLRFAQPLLISSALIMLFASPAGLRAAPADGTTNADTFSVERFSAKLADLKGKPAAIQHYNLSADKVGLEGFDPVQYFTESRALKGSKQITAQHLGVTYH